MSSKCLEKNFLPYSLCILQPSQNQITQSSLSLICMRSAHPQLEELFSSLTKHLHQGIFRKQNIGPLYIFICPVRSFFLAAFVLYFTLHSHRKRKKKKTPRERTFVQLSLPPSYLKNLKNKIQTIHLLLSFKKSTERLDACHSSAEQLLFLLWST